jgi:uncharacterized repeat protein (TIGR01451 family)
LRPNNSGQREIDMNMYRPKLVNSLSVGLICLLAGAWSVARAAEPVTNTLTVQRIAKQSDGHEVSEAAGSVRPGDLLEYSAQFHNAGDKAANALVATLPIPVGTEFVPGSTKPAAVLASLDGETFAELPLKRTVKRADGTFHEELVPPSEYRFLRWAPMDLPGHGALTVSARVHVSGVTTASQAVHPATSP